MFIVKESISFIKELHRRNNIFFYLGTVLFALFFLFLITFKDCKNSLSEICHWLKPCKFAVSFAVYVWTLGWFLEYLKGTLTNRKIRGITWLITTIVLTEIIIILLQCWLTSDSYLRLQFSSLTTERLTRGFYILGNSVIIADAVVLAFITAQFFRKNALQPVSYLWSIRAGFVVLILSSFLGAFLIALYGQVSPDPNRYGLPFTSFSNIRDILVSLHFLGIHYLQGLPFVCYFFQKQLGKKFILFSVGLYILVCLFFIFIALN